VTLPLFATVYSAVFAAELVADKTLYTISMLAGRCRPMLLACGFGLAFMVKMLAAVLFGRLSPGCHNARYAHQR
jgi:putative Ca2+/H+ antiporter (TMEM165/GDT1 family)